MPNGPIEAIIHAAEVELGHLSPTPFSPAAFATLRDKISVYVAELVAESGRISRRHRADTVSAAHVDQAADYLVADSGRRFYRHLGTIGGILLGAAVGNLLSMITANQFSFGGVVVTCALGIVGSFLIALHIAKE